MFSIDKRKNSSYQNMKKAILFFLLCLSLGWATSCSESDNETDENTLHPIEPPYEPMFQFDEQGIPYRLNSPTLSLEMQRDVQNEALGHGWKWMQTFEIQDNGFVKSEDFYKEMIGPSPTSYYIKSDKELVRYFLSDANHATAFHTQAFTMDTKAGVLSDGNSSSGITPQSFLFRIWGIYKLNRRWYMDTIEPLGTRLDENGVSKTVWGYSHYFRMSDDELRQMQNEYTFDYSSVN